MKKTDSFDRLEKFVLELARYAHKDQVRKYTGEPYIHHLIGVANLVKEYGGSTEMVCAALLHDVVEDTSTSDAQLYQILSATELSEEEARKIVSLVMELTDRFVKENYPDLNRRQRKALECERLSQISPDAQTIKLCDLIDNSSTIRESGNDFARVYLAEKQDILKVMTMGNPQLYERAMQTGR
ncbi:hypothetical protein DYBT9275_02807 [Dyadobacter sp. CECT 9275]|uniref:HD/PDEase domain-containing protein n=1 Tax=Dyadobacter helix TaxID=2822344 RepID=A0A916JGD9_9BACT|nr:HD domain-containing protein [Dyadobacter sp. CECT 9275]CAG5002097.1 hypothetical protein DYBT9275_02807 [Dyadobacter sp. CECT 9275]